MNHPAHIIVVMLALSIAGCTQQESLEPSRYTVTQGLEMLEPLMPTGQYKRKIKTVPILTREDEFHWVMKDGHIWTKFEHQGEGDPVIVGYKYEVNESEDSQP